MAQLTAGFYFTRNWSLVQLVSSSIIGGLTVWLVNLFGGVGPTPPGPYGVTGTAQYVETGVALPPSNVPPIGPLATFFNPGASAPPQIGGEQGKDIMYPIGTVSTTQGSTSHSG